MCTGVIKKLSKSILILILLDYTVLNLFFFDNLQQHWSPTSFPSVLALSFNLSFRSKLSRWKIASFLIFLLGLLGWRNMLLLRQTRLLQLYLNKLCEPGHFYRCMLGALYLYFLIFLQLDGKKSNIRETNEEFWAFFFPAVCEDWQNHPLYLVNFSITFYFFIFIYFFLGL